MMTDAGRARDALQSIPPDLPRDEWVRAGMAAHAAGIDFDTFNDWSAQAANYTASDARDTWRSFKPGKGVGAGTLYRMAAELGGWRMGGDKPHARPFEAPRKAAEPPRKPAPGMSPAEVWNRSEPATDAHPYIKAKQGRPDGLRVVPAGDPLRVAGESMAGALVVPVLRQDGTVSTLQLIAPPETAQRLKAAGKPGKLNLPGFALEGFYAVGELVPSGAVYLCEGIGQAWAAWKATGRAAVVCFGWGRVRTVAAELRQSDASARLVLVPDVGKEADAEKIAREVGAAVATMPEGWPQNSDVNDLAQRDGFDVLEILLSDAAKPPPPLLRPVSVADALSNPAPPPAFVWDGYLPRGTVSLFGAHGGTGKSTIALMLLVCAALGRPLFGVPTIRTKSLFVSLEDGENVVRHRLASICRAWGIDPAELHDLHIVDGTDNPELFASEGRAGGEPTATHGELCKLVQAEGYGLVAVDNASDAYGGDEIQRRQVRAFMRLLGGIAKRTDCAVMLLAHVDKNTSRNKRAEGGEGYSGSTAWHNSARSRLFLSRGDSGLLTLEHQKSNLGRMREPLTLEWPEGGLPQLVQGFDADGFTQRQAGRDDDNRAAELLKLIAEFESRGQYCSPATTSRNNPHAVLKSEPAFQRLKLRPDDTRRIVNQCQRAKWLEPLEYRTHDRKTRLRWTLTPEGRAFAGLGAPSAPCAPSSDESAQSAQSAEGAPSAPSSAGGTGERERAQESAEVASDD
ncbi:MAG: AAA family ATPase [Burkholderiaceae bacterium]|jgi:hypothetical protein